MAGNSNMMSNEEVIREYVRKQQEEEIKEEQRIMEGRQRMTCQELLFPKKATIRSVVVF
jgi:hypothetical protein